MASVATYIDIPKGVWTNVTPDLSGSTVTVINASAGVVHFRVATATPSADDEGGQPLGPREGFVKKDIADLTFKTGTLRVYAMTYSNYARLWTEFVDTN